MSLTNTSSFSLSSFLFMPQGEWEGGSVKIATCRGSTAHFFGGFFTRDSSLRIITTKIHIKWRNCVFFTYKILCSEYARMQDFVSIFQKISSGGGTKPPKKLGNLFKFKSDLFNKNELKTLIYRS